MKQKTLAAFAFLMICAVVSAQTPTDVTITAPDGAKLKGSYFNAKQPGPAVILLHQCNRERHAWSELALRLSEKGIRVLTVDYRGYGESDGVNWVSLPAPERRVIQSDQWPGDVDAALQYLLSQPGVDRNRIGAGGASCGVNQAIQLAKRNSLIKSLVLLSGPATPQALEFLQKSPSIPILASAADDDQGEVATMQWILAFSRNPSNKFIHYTSGGHGADMFVFQPELVPAIVSWFNTTLNARSMQSTAEAPPSDAEKFWSVLHENGGAARALQMFQDARKKDPNAFPFPEAEVNALGYQRLQEDNSKEAIDVFALNVAAYPDSPNVYDSIADAYAAAGQNDRASEFAKKAIDALEHDTTMPEQTKNGIRASAMQKIHSDQKQTPARPPADQIVKMPIVLKVPGMENAKVQRDVVYKSVGGTDLKMDVYLPPDATPAKKVPVVIFISGAGNDPPSPKEWGVYRTYGQLMAANGIAGVEFNKRYARNSNILEAEADVKDLITHIRKNADSMNLDGDRICAVAYSAGGRLLTPFFREKIPGVKCLGSFYGVMGGDASLPAGYSPLAQVGVSGQKLPIFIARAGLDDPTLNAGLDAFVREATAKGFELQVFNHAEGQHAFDILDDNDRSREIIQAFVAFLRNSLSVPGRGEG